MVTIADVAHHAGVSPKTVSNVLNGYKYLRPETKARVERSIRELGYTVNLAARGLRKGSTGMITLAVPDLREPYLAELSDAIIRAAQAHDIRVMVTQTGGSRQQELDILHGPNRHFTDGTILSPAALGPADLDEYEVDFPLVLLGERITHPKLDRVTLPNALATQTLTSYMLQAGCQRLVLLGADSGTHHGSAPLRERGFRQAHLDAGLPVDESLVINQPYWKLSNGADCTSRLLESGAQFDGIVAMNDSLAIGALHSLHAHDVHVPEDMLVAGIDNIEDAAYTSPTLTSISVDHEDFAKQAVSALLMRITEAKNVSEMPRFPQQTVQATFNIEVRESTRHIPVPEKLLQS